MELTLKTPPVIEPVTVEDAKKQCVIESSFTGDDALLERMIATVRLKGEALVGRQFVAAEYVLTVREWDRHGPLRLPKPPLQSVKSIVCVDADSIEHEIAAEEYEVIAESLASYIEPVKAWPEGKKIVVTFVTGWPVGGDGSAENPFVATTPKDIQTWMLMRVSDLYENREGFVIGQSVAELPSSFVDGFLDAHIVPVVV